MSFNELKTIQLYADCQICAGNEFFDLCQITGYRRSQPEIIGSNWSLQKIIKLWFNIIQNFILYDKILSNDISLGSELDVNFITYWNK